MSDLSFDLKSLNSKDQILYEKIVAKRKNVNAPFDGPYTALMNHPELCEKIEALGFYLKFQGHLPRDIYQFIVLNVAKSTNASFEWDDHAAYALSAGVPEKVIDALKNYPADLSFPDPYRLAHELLTYVLKWQNIPEPLQNAGISFYGIKGFIEIVTLSGFYQLMSAINQGFDIKKH